MNTENKDLGPTQEEMDELHAQWEKEREAQERWWIDEHNGEHQYDPPMEEEPNWQEMHDEQLADSQINILKDQPDDLPF